MDSLTKAVITEFEKSFEAESQKPLKVAIFGQTGVGKSSLLNALFHTDLKTSAVTPTTKEICEISVKGKDEHILFFYDMPGIGESAQVDEKYLQQYRQLLLDADVVLWCLYADNRSITFDQEAFSKLLGHLDDTKRSVLMSKITLVLTKADVLVPPPWIFSIDGHQGLFSPGPDTETILERKEEYYQGIFLEPYGDIITSRTYLPDNAKFSLREEGFSMNDYHVFYNGWMSKSQVASLNAKYPQYSAVFERLYNSYRVISCSSLYRYNLSELMLVILNKLGKDAFIRFQHFVDGNALSYVLLDNARKLSNMVFFDTKRRKRIFDLEQNLYRL